MKKKFWRNRRFLLLTIVLLTALLLLILYLHYTSPAYVKRLIQEKSTGAINGSVSVGDARLQIFRGLKLDDIELTLSEKSTPDIAVEHILCDWNAAAFLHGDVEPNKLVFVRPRVRLYRDENSYYNIRKLFKAFEPKTDTAKTAVDKTAYERYFTQGLSVESGELAWIAPEVFKDDNERVFSKMDVRLYPSPETVNRWDLSALVRGDPFCGVRIDGWMDLTPKAQRLRFHGEGHELPITPELEKYLPRVGREVVSRLDMSGKATIAADIAYTRGSPPEFAFNADLHNTDVRLRATRLKARSADISLRFDRRGFVCDRFAGVLWDGGLVGGAASHPTGGSTAWVRLENADIARMAEEMGLKDTEMRGLISGSARFRIGAPDEELLTGEGSVQINNAHLAKLPLLSYVFQVLNFRFPGGEVFDRGEAKFSIVGNRIYVESLTVSSPSVEIAATGTIDFDGTADLVLLVASSNRDPGWLITRPIRFLLESLERQISPPVAITGPLSNPNVEILTMEPVTRQLRNLRDLLPFVGSAPKENKK